MAITSTKNPKQINMKKIFTTSLFFVSLLALAQEYKMKVGLKLLPETTIKFSDDYPDSEFVKHKFELFSFNYGIQYVYSFTDRIGFETGIYYQSQKYQTTYITNSLTVDTQFQLIQMPISLRFDFDYLYFTLGGSLNYQLATKWDGSDGSHSTGGGQNDGSILVGLIGTVGRDWKVSDKVSILTEIRLSGAPGKAVGANAGLGLGANYKL